MSHVSQFTLALVSAAVCLPLCAQSPGEGSSGSPTQGTDQPKTDRAATQTPATQPAKPKGLEWTLGDFKVKLGGYVKVDLIHDFDEIGSTDSFDPRTIPLNDEVDHGVNTRMHARQTRFNLDVRGPSTAGEVRVFFEGDFFGANETFRIRHAFGTVGPVLGGQTWTTFMDEDCMPETLDFETPIAFPQIRQAQIRYTESIGNEGSYWAVAVEDPRSNVIPPPVAGEVEEATPDLTGRLRLKHGLGHTQFSLFLGQARFDPVGGSPDQVFLWGINGSTKLNLCSGDALFAQATYGDGVGRYRGGITAAPDTSGNLEAVNVIAGMLGYEHHWSDEWRSTASYSLGKGDNPGGAPPTTTEELSYFAANLIWQFSNRAWVGIEYLRGTIEAVDNTRGNADRVQLAIRFDI